MLFYMDKKGLRVQQTNEHTALTAMSCKRLHQRAALAR
jgi:hypothetical protein